MKTTVHVFRSLLVSLLIVSLLALALWGIRGCSRQLDADDNANRVAEKQSQWKEPERKITVTITVNKYNRQECKEAGGTFVIGDTKELLNALVGCIEKEK